MQFMAHVFGETPHRSLLLRRLSRLGLSEPEDLMNLAVQRGCSHYGSGGTGIVVEDPGAKALTNEQLAVAMCSAAQKYHPQMVRCAAQLLSASGIDFDRLIQLARQERCLPILLEVAKAASDEVDDVEGPWELLNMHQSAGQPKIPSGRLPHSSRYMVLPGRSRSGKVGRPYWLRRKPMSETADL